MAVVVRLGGAADVDDAVAVFERSNLARRQGSWPNRVTRVDRVRAHLREPTSWFLVAAEGPADLAMVAAEPLRAEDGAAPSSPVAGSSATASALLTDAPVDP